MSVELSSEIVIPKTHRLCAALSVPEASTECALPEGGGGRRRWRLQTLFAVAAVQWKLAQRVRRFSLCHSPGRVRLFALPRTVAHQAPLSMGFSRQEYQSGLPFPSPEDLPDPGIELWSPALQSDSLPFELQGSPLSKCK